MKARFYAVLFIAGLFGCQQGQMEKVYHPRALTANDDFNTYPKQNDVPFTVLKPVVNEEQKTGSVKPELFSVKFRDTIVSIQINEADKNAVVDKFTLAQFVNTQKTCLLVQIADQSGLVAPFYLLTLKNDQIEVISLYRPSTGKQDREMTKGMIRVSSTGYLINNDFFVTNVNAKVYPIKRQNQKERIQGEFFLKSADKHTLVFLLSDSFYEVHYPTGETFTQPFTAGVPTNKGRLYSWVQSNFSWQKNGKGISFLKANMDNDRIIDISEFK